MKELSIRILLSAFGGAALYQSMILFFMDNAVWKGIGSMLLGIIILFWARLGSFNLLIIDIKHLEREKCVIKGCGAKAQKVYRGKKVCCDCYNELSAQGIQS